MLAKHAFGHSPLSTTRIGLGMAALGRPGYITLGHGQDLPQDYAVSAMAAQARQVLQYAWDQGLRYFDTARSYGRGEEFLGSWLQQSGFRADELMIGSKWGYIYTANWQVDAAQHEVKEHSLTVLDRQWQESEQHLGHYLALYQIHSATLESGVLDNAAVLNRLAQHKAQGILIGLSLSGTNQEEMLRKAMKVKIDGIALFDSVQATYNLLEVSAGQALREAHQAGMGVIIKEALANGRLTHRNQEAKMRLLHEEAALRNVSSDALALAGVLAQPWVNIVLSGAATIEQLQSNLRAGEVVWDSALGERLESLREAPEQYWQSRKALRWN